MKSPALNAVGVTTVPPDAANSIIIGLEFDESPETLTGNSVLASKFKLPPTSTGVKVSEIILVAVTSPVMLTSPVPVISKLLRLKSPPRPIAVLIVPVTSTFPVFEMLPVPVILYVFKSKFLPNPLTDKLPVISILPRPVKS